MNIKSIFKIISLPVVAASLCCLSPVVLVLLGLSTASFASSLADTLYGTYKWIFRGFGLILLVISLVIYFYKEKNICTLDQAKRRKNEIINITVLALTVAILGYLFWLYVVVEYAGILLKIW